MARHSRSSSFDASLIGLLAIGAIAWAYRKWLIYVAVSLISLLMITLLVKLLRRLHLHRRNLAMSKVDEMNDLDFERYIAKLLNRHGFKRVRLTEHYDKGVDIIAEKEGVRWGIQVKHYHGLVKAAAVRQVVTALNYYRCDRSMVITNSGYSKVAKQLAVSNRCILIDRQQLVKLIS